MTATRKLVVVLGAHRSGTSVCAAAVAALGASLGEGVTYANEENPKGFFEHPAIVDFNDRLLEHLQGSWDNPLFDGSRVIASMNLDALRAQAAQLLGQLFGQAELVAIKDPRICQLLPFWQPVFEQAGYGRNAVYYVHTFRGVAEVAASTQSRAQSNPDYYDLGLNPAEGAALWLSLTSQSLLETRGKQCAYLSFHRLLEEPRPILGRLAQFLDVQADEEEIDRFCESFVDRQLKRASEDANAVAELESLQR